MNPAPTTVARNAMATRFELALHGPDPVALRAAAEEALDEVQRVEAMLNWRNPASPIARLNARADREPVRVNAELFALLRSCREYWELSGGAFDLTIGPLMRAWGFHAADGKVSDPAAIEAARETCGMAHVELDAASSTVRFHRPGMRLDFGAVGKGYALELAAEILRDAGVTSALLHGGTSTVKAVGHPPDATHWKVAVEYPPGSGSDAPPPVLAVLELRDTAMSVSAVWGRVLRAGPVDFGHVLDPRTGQPVDHALLSIYAADNATESDALSTALLTEGPAGVAQLLKVRPAARTLVLARNGEGGYTITSQAIVWLPSANRNSPVASGPVSP